MSDWTSYQFQDFVPFTAEIYYRLQERTGEIFWPLHLMTLLLGGLSLFWAINQRPRIACLLLAPLWAWVGVGYFLQRYAALNWAGHYIGWAFLAQALLFLVLAITHWKLVPPANLQRVPAVIGLLTALFGLLVYPLVAPLLGHPWFQAETFGIHPTPTAITSVGVILLISHGVGQWLVAVIPLLWLLFSGMTLRVVNAPWDNVLFSVVALCLIGMAGNVASNNPDTH